MNFAWEIISFDTKDETNFEGDLLVSSVSLITWKRTCTSLNGVTVAYLGKTNISSYNNSTTDYIRFEFITEQIALDWITNTLSDDDIGRIDSMLIDKINKTELVKKDPPWIS